jgi:hypothetical protein
MITFAMRASHVMITFAPRRRPTPAPRSSVGGAEWLTDWCCRRPQDRRGDWTEWESAAGVKGVRGGPGSLMFVPSGCPHAFTNPAAVPARMLFLAARPATNAAFRRWPS